VNGFLLEVLFPTGWRRAGDIHWRFADAELAARQALDEDLARAARVLPVQVLPAAVLELTARQEGEANDR